MFSKLESFLKASLILIRKKKALKVIVQKAKLKSLSVSRIAKHDSKTISGLQG